MIRCALCNNRIRPPSRPWTEAEDGRIHFYQTTTDMKVYAKELARLARRIPFIHEACIMAAEPGTLPHSYIRALNLDVRLRHQQQKGG